jgi:hypothetical protein
MLASVAAASSVSPIVQYSFPASWDGTGDVVTDLSPAGNDGGIAGTPILLGNIPPGADASTQSLATLDGGVQTDATQLLANSVLEASGGFQYEVSFLWDGRDTGFGGTQKIIDYAGTESLQLENADEDASPDGVATLRFLFNDNAEGPTVEIQANTWYHVVATFDTMGNVADGDGSIAGTASLVVDGAAPVSEAITKTDFGDGLERPIGFGTLAIAGGIVNLAGVIHDPTVSLLPEPSSLLLLGLGAFALVRRR